MGNLRLARFFTSLLLAFSLAAALPTAALADEGEPPPPTEEPALTSEGGGDAEPAPDAGSEESTPVEEPGASIEVAADEAAAEPALESTPEMGSEETLPAEDTTLAEPADLLAELPEGTEVVVLDADGNQLSLASEEAAEILSAGDPMWCPAGVTPGGAGCSAPFGSLSALVAGFVPTGNGVIWIEGGVDAGANVTINGVGSWAAAAGYTLSLKGGWNGIMGSTITDPLNPSVFDTRIAIINWNNSITISDIVLSGALALADDALEVSTNTGNVVLTRVTAQGNDVGSGNYGARIINNSASGTVNITNSAFSSQTGGSGLRVDANGGITLSSVIANSNAQRGAYLDNSGGAGNIVISNSTFNSNNSSGFLAAGGLEAYSKGTITLTNVKANTNGGATAQGFGALLDNSSALSAKNVTVTATTNNHNEFNQNRRFGLQIMSMGLVTIKDVTASENGLANVAGFGSGLVINNTYGTMGVTFTGTNIFNDNMDHGLWILSDGAITLNNIIANSNGNASNEYGALLDNSTGLAKAITLTGINQFKFNYDDNLYIRSNGLITLYNITANSSQTEDGADMDNTSGTAGVVIKGVNFFLDNDEYGLKLYSNGNISANSLTANYNGLGGGGEGAFLSNFASATFAGVTVTGTNTFNGNQGSGLYISSTGTLSLNSINASDNLGSNGGVSLSNTWFAHTDSKKAVTLTGTNVFNGNQANGLKIYSYGPITISNITALSNGNTSYSGVVLDNCNLVGTACTTTTAQPVTVNVANINGNADAGLFVQSKGNIKVTSITASENGFGAGASWRNGAYLDNCLKYWDVVLITYVCGVTSPQTVTLTGTNTFNGNKNTGLYIESRGAISLSNVTANDSDSAYGAQLNNAWPGVELAPQNVTLSGTNTFNDNNFYGLYVTSFGTITLNATTANGNGSYGASLDNCLFIGSPTNQCTALTPKNVVLTGANTFNENSTGVYIASRGSIAAKSLTAKDNVGDGVYFDNCLKYDSDPTPSTYYVCAVTGANVTVSGTNVLTGNYYGIEVYSAGTISLNNVTASNNDASGAYLDNCFIDYGGTNLCTNTAVKGVTVSGTNTMSSNAANYGLQVYSNGAVTVNSLTASSNGLSGFGYGALIENYWANGLQNVTLTGTNAFVGNKNGGLSIASNGAVTVNSVMATGTTTGFGLYILNDTSGTGFPKDVKITGTNNFSDNSSSGLIVASLGAISLNNVTASNNGDPGSYSGAILNNCNEAWDPTPPAHYYCDVLFPKGIVLTGTNTFNGNGYTGLDIWTSGPVSSSTSLTASNNGTIGSGYGLYLVNYNPGAVGGVSLLGKNAFTGNAYFGAQIFTRGAASLDDVTASENGILGSYGNGLFVDNCIWDVSACLGSGNVSLTGTNTFNGNYQAGLFIYSAGNISTNNLTVMENLSDGAQLYNDTVEGKTVILNGVNNFSSNKYSGLQVNSYGAITLNSVTATYNGISGGSGSGVNLNNSAASAAPTVKITGTSVLNGNDDYGLVVNTKGSITLSNITANYNDAGGAALTNNTGTLAGVTLTGVNNFNYNASGYGLYISTSGVVSLSKITADGNGVTGLYTAGATSITITCGWFTGNGNRGMDLTASSSITLKGVISSGNAATDSLSPTPAIARTC